MLCKHKSRQYYYMCNQYFLVVIVIKKNNLWTVHFSNISIFLDRQQKWTEAKKMISVTSCYIFLIGFLPQQHLQLEYFLICTVNLQKCYLKKNELEIECNLMTFNSDSDVILWKEIMTTKNYWLRYWIHIGSVNHFIQLLLHEMNNELLL